METTKLRTLIKTEAAVLGGTVWPNGIGFDARGWMYQYDERTCQWMAVRRKRFGRGETPEAAKANARGRS